MLIVLLATSDISNIYPRILIFVQFASNSVAQAREHPARPNSIHDNSILTGGSIIRVKFDSQWAGRDQKASKFGACAYQIGQGAHKSPPHSPHHHTTLGDVRISPRLRRRQCTHV